MPVEIEIPLGSGDVMAANLGGKSANPTVIFAHGSGSGRHSRRNRHVAGVLEQAGFETLLLDLLTPQEEQVDTITREHRFDIALLTDRVIEAMAWLEKRGDAGRMGLFGASTGAAAALGAAAARPGSTGAVVSRGGRPDLAGDDLERVEAPSLLIVGGNDPQVLELNREALQRLNDESELEIVAGATHLFEEPGKLDEVAQLAAGWFRRHLG